MLRIAAASVLMSAVDAVEGIGVYVETLIPLQGHGQVHLKHFICSRLWIDPFKIWTKAVAACHQIKTVALIGAGTQPS